MSTTWNFIFVFISRDDLVDDINNGGTKTGTRLLPN